jgi:membrane-associated protease RseP (regulator of RpoE activity)
MGITEILASITGFIVDHKWVLLVYLILALLIYINRRKFTVENKIFLLHRSQFGINAINNFADKHKGFLKTLGYAGIGIGFLGMGVMCFFFLQGIFNLLFVPSAPPTVSLVLPGIKVPGSPVFIPFEYGIIALFVVILFHEFGHGIIARAHGIKIQNTGFGFLGPIPLAFVEPDEKKVLKQGSEVQNSIFAAGPFFNVILTGFAFLILALLFYPLADPNHMMSVSYGDTISMVDTAGFQFSALDKGYPAEAAGLKPDTIYNTINGQKITNVDEFSNAIMYVRPGETLTISNAEETVSFEAAENPRDSSRGYLGIIGYSLAYEIKNDAWWYVAIYNILNTLMELIEWIAILSLGIGLANLLPLGPVDGGRMLLIALIDSNGKDKGTKLWSKISVITLVVLIILVLVPMIKSIIGL